MISKAFQLEIIILNNNSYINLYKIIIKSKLILFQNMGKVCSKEEDETS